MVEVGQRRNLINGTAVPPNGIRLPAMSMPGSIRVMNRQNGMDQSGLLQLQGIWVVQTMTQTGTGMRGLWDMEKGGRMTLPIATIKAKPTQTDPEDDLNVEPSLPVGSTSHTSQGRMDDSGSKQTVARSLIQLYCCRGPQSCWWLIGGPQSDDKCHCGPQSCYGLVAVVWLRNGYVPRTDRQIPCSLFEVFAVALRLACW